MLGYQLVANALLSERHLLQEKYDQFLLGYYAAVNSFKHLKWMEGNGDADLQLTQLERFNYLLVRREHGECADARLLLLNILAQSRLQMCRDTIHKNSREPC